jgi:RimJ/RimL family protein N-acetyltransferase
MTGAQMNEAPSSGAAIGRPNVTLRPVRLADAAQFQRWSLDPETRRLQAGNRAPLSAEEAHDFTRRLLGGHEDGHVALMIEMDGRTVGNTWLANIDRDNASATLGIVMGEATSRGRGVGTEVLRQMVDMGFDRLGLERIELWVLADNMRAIRAYERVGFRREGLRRGHIRWGDERLDTILMAVLRTDRQS